VFAAHDGDLPRLRRCPICKWAIEQDHAEALASYTMWPPNQSHIPAELAPEKDLQEAAAVMGFTLV
jgi:hypothetical protein